MYREFLTARSPLRLLEKGLHGGLGKGNLGLVLAGHGVGKTSFLVCVALDDLLRGEHVLHVSLDQTVAHTRAHYAMRDSPAPIVMFSSNCSRACSRVQPRRCPTADCSSSES